MIAPNSPPGSDRLLRTRRDVRFRVVGEEGVVVRQEAGEVWVVNEVGARVLALLDGRRTLAAAAAILAEEFDVEPELLAADLAAYVEELLLGGVLEEVAAER